MTRSLRPYLVLALAAVVLGFLENALFGSDTPGTAHVVSVGFFFLLVAGVVALVALGGMAVARRVRGSAASR